MGVAGWRGFLLVNGQTLPYNSSDLSETKELYFPSLIHPDFERNAGLGRTFVQGNIRGEIFGGDGQFNDAAISLLTAAINFRTRKTGLSSLVFNPGTSSSLTLPSASATNPIVVVSKLSLRGDSSRITTFDAHIMSTGYDVGGGPGGLVFETAGATDDVNPASFWNSTFSVSGSGESGLVGGDQVTSWELHIDNNTNPIWGFSGQYTPYLIHQGVLTARGRFNYFSPTGQFVRSLTHGSQITINIGNIRILCPYIVFDQSPTTIGGENDPAYREVNFACLGDSGQASVALY